MNTVATINVKLQGFFALPKVYKFTNANAVKELEAKNQDAKKTQFLRSVQIGDHIKQAWNWLDTEPAKAEMKKAGVEKPNKEQFGFYAYGFSKAMIYRYLQVAEIAPSVVDSYMEQSEKFDLVELISFDKSGKEGEAPKVRKPVEKPIFELRLKFPEDESGILIKVLDSGVQTTQATLQQAKDALNFLSTFVENLEKSETIAAGVLADKVKRSGMSPEQLKAAKEAA